MELAHLFRNIVVAMISATPSTSTMDDQRAVKKARYENEKIDGDLSNQEKEKEVNETNKQYDTFTRKRPQRQRTYSSSQKDKPTQQPDPLYVSKKSGKRISRDRKIH